LRFSVIGQLLAAPPANRYRHFTRIEIRYASWDLTQIHLVDDRTGQVLCRLFPQDKAQNASGWRRSLEPIATAPIAVPRAGRVLLYAAEDALHIVRRRLEGICTAAGVALADLDVQVITAPTVRLDLEADRRALDDTVAKLQPRLLVLDPFVRLHRIDENASGEVAPLLAYLRELQRRHGVAVVVVHHAKKGAGRIRAGQALRGSSEFHAWGDSNLYLRRNGDDLTLTVEHRAAPAMPTVTLELTQRANALALEVIERRAPSTPPPSSVDERITTALSDAARPLPFSELRGLCRVRTASLYERLAALTAAGRLAKSDQGYLLTAR
jgi:AAA domain-containing protein